MANPDGNDAAEERLTFGRYVVDLNRGCLLLDGREIALRPKTFAVLVHLATHPGHLVSKEQLLAAVWPNLVVTDDTLVQSIGELRRALGESGARLITTVPRRGYRFEGAAPPATPDAPLAREAPGTSDTTPPSTPTPHAPRRGWKLALFASLTAALAVTAVWVGTRFRDSETVVESAAIKPAIAVLPFQDQSDDASREYLADGLSQDLINSLGRFSALTVMSWNAVAAYKGAAAPPGEIARALDVRYQVEGSVRYTAEQVRVSAQLVDMQGRVLWSARFDEAPADLFALEDRITREIAGALAIRVSDFEQQRAFAKPTANFDAYDYVLRARPALRRPTRANIVEARDLLRRAIALDPEYAAAHSALGETFHVAISMGWAESPDDYWKRVEAEAGEALRLDPADVRGRILLARSHIAYNRYPEAQAEIDRAIAINPNDADALAGRGNILVWLGETDAAIESLRIAQRIDPELNDYDSFALTLAYYLKGDYPAAIAQAELNLRRNAGAHFNRAVLAAAHAQAGRPDEAARVAEEIRRIDPTFEGAEFGNKFLNAADLERLREGLRKAGLYAASN